jgi:hypothetical protein
MILEIVLFGLLGGLMGASTCLDDYMNKKRMKELPVTQPTRSPFAEIVIELLRSDEGWKSTTENKSVAVVTELTHESGVVVRNARYIMVHDQRSVDTVYVLSEQGNYEEAELTNGDLGAIVAEVKAYHARAAARKQEELQTALARRILARENGDPVLGGDGIRLPEDDSLAGPDPVPANLLTFDPQTRKVVPPSAGKSYELSERLLRRYELSGARKMMVLEDK